MLMPRHLIRAGSLLACLMIIPGSYAQDLTFEERVQAQREIERVYYSYLNGGR